MTNQKYCFITVPENWGDWGDKYTNQRLLPGRYIMRYYGPSWLNQGEVIIESFFGILITIPKEWIKKEL